MLSGGRVSDSSKCASALSVAMFMFVRFTFPALSLLKSASSYVYLIPRKSTRSVQTLHCNGNNAFVVLRKPDDELLKFSPSKPHESLAGFIIEILHSHRPEREAENFGGDNETYLLGFLHSRNLLSPSLWITDTDEA